jgi:hypothetical protein
MAQSALTVTPPNPSPPTNFSSTGATPPNPPNYTAASYNEPDNWGTGTNSAPPPYFDDGTAGSDVVFAANTAALASGTGDFGGTAGGTPGTYPGAGGAEAGEPPWAGDVPASSSVAHEGAGTEVVVTSTVPNPSPAGQLRTFSCLGAYTTNPNGQHASSLSPITNPALASISPASVAAGAGTQLLTATGTNFTRQSVINVNGVNQATTYVSPTSLTATVTKKLTAGTWPVIVITGGAVQTAPQTWTFT